MAALPPRLMADDIASVCDPSTGERSVSITVRITGQPLEVAVAMLAEECERFARRVAELERNAMPAWRRP